MMHCKKILCFVAAAIICLLAFVSCTPRDGMQENADVNALGETMPKILYFKDGDIFLKNGDSTVRIAENAYDADADSPVYTADYAIDKSTGKIVYVSENTLYYFNGAECMRIADNVKNWRINAGMRIIAYTLAWTENGTETENLFLYRNGETVHCGTGLTDITLTESYVYALKQNNYPKVRNTLYKFDFDGNRETVNTDVPKIMWASDSTVLCGESADGELYTYYILHGGKCEKIGNVYHASVTDSGRTLYVIADYDTVISSGKLIAIGLDKLSQKLLAENVHFFSTDAVTMPDKGLIYSVRTDREHDRYSVYYCDVAGRSARLIHNTSADAMYNIAINNKNGTGWLLSEGAQPDDGAVYRIKISKGTVESERIATGDFGSLVYYGMTDSVTFAGSPESGECTLYAADSDGVRTLTNECSVERITSGYRSQCVLSRSGKKLMYFASLVSKESTPSGRLCVTPDKVIAEDVASGYTLSPITYGELDEIYYLVPSNGRYELYFYSGESSLIASGVDGMLEI